MTPIDFKESNIELSATGCKKLRAFTDGNTCVSKWYPSFRDLFRLFFGGGIWLCIQSGNTQPPVCVTTDYPFIEQDTDNHE